MENNKSRLRSLIAYEYFNWIINPRMILFVCLLLFITSYVADGFNMCSATLNQPLGIFEIFIAVSNSAELCVLIPVVFIILTADFPRKNANTLLYVHRMGKYKWFAGQIIIIVLEILTYLASILISCMIMINGNAVSGNKWSEVVTKYAVTFPDDKNAIVTQLISGRLYNNFTPYKTVLYSFTLLFAMLFFLAMLKLVFFFINRSTVGMVVVSVLLICGWTFGMIDMKIKWIFPLSHVIEWQHCDLVFKKMVVSMGESYLYFIVLSIVMVLASLIRLGRFDFITSK